MRMGLGICEREICARGWAGSKYMHGRDLCVFVLCFVFELQAAIWNVAWEFAFLDVGSQA